MQKSDPALRWSSESPSQTPRLRWPAATFLVALLEQAAVVALGPLDEGLTSVGTRIEMDHLAATAVGSTVIGTAEVTAAEGRRVEFAVAALEGEKRVAQGRHTRVIVDRERFLGV